MAGLTAAAYLAREGCEVDVFEQGRPRNDDQTLIVLKVE